MFSHVIARYIILLVHKVNKYYLVVIDKLAYIKKWNIQNEIWGRYFLPEIFVLQFSFYNIFLKICMTKSTNIYVVAVVVLYIYTYIYMRDFQQYR